MRLRVLSRFWYWVGVSPLKPMTERLLSVSANELYILTDAL